MNPMDGITATARFKAVGGPPVLILTTFDTQSDIVAAIEAGALGYLLKDAPPEQVHTAVLDTATGKNTLAPDIAAALVMRMQRSQVTLSARTRVIEPSCHGSYQQETRSATVYFRGNRQNTSGAYLL